MQGDIDPSAYRDVPNARAPLHGVVTAGQPTAAQIAALATAGITRVIDLRPASEERGFDEAAAAAAAGVDYRNIPVTGGTLGAREFDAVREALRARGSAPTLLHCASANRVGAVLIPYLVLDEGQSPDAALALAREVGLRSDELAQKAFDYVADQPGPAGPR